MSPESAALEFSAPVIAATDFSTNSETGVNWASSVAGALEAPLRLVHATLESSSLGDFLGVEDGALGDLERREAGRLQAIAGRLADGGLKATWSMRRGTPSEVVVDCARELDAHLIVIGTRGRRGLSHLMLGSTAERVAQRAPCPVLSVHPDDGPAAWPPRRVLVATDFSAESSAALTALITLCGGTGTLCGGPGPTALTLLHACHVPYQLGSESPCASVTEGSELRREITGDVERRLNEFGAAPRRAGFAVDTLFCEGHPDDLVLERADELKADLIVMGTRGRSGLAHVLLGSTAQRVIQRSICPVLTSRAAVES